MPNLKKAFSKIYDQYIEKIYRFIFLKVNSKETAEDLTSETFLKCWEAFKEKEIENPQAFLYQIARNLIVDHYRQKEKFQTVPIENNPISDPRQNLQEASNLNLEIERVRTALSKLKDEYQDVLIFYYLEGIPVRKIAKILDRTETATRVLIHRALNSLREELKIQKV